MHGDSSHNDASKLPDWIESDSIRQVINNKELQHIWLGMKALPLVLKWTRNQPFATVLLSSLEVLTASNIHRVHLVYFSILVLKPQEKGVWSNQNFTRTSLCCWLFDSRNGPKTMSHSGQMPTRSQLQERTVISLQPMTKTHRRGKQIWSVEAACCAARSTAKHWK